MLVLTGQNRLRYLKWTIRPHSHMRMQVSTILVGCPKKVGTSFNRFVFKKEMPRKMTRESTAPLRDCFFLSDSPTAVVYLTYRDDKFHRCQAGQLNTAFGNMFHTVSVRQLSNMPSFLPAGSIGKDLLNISDAKLYKLNDQIKEGQEGGPSEGAVNLAHALFLPLTIPELKHLWIIEDDFVFDGDSIKQLVDFHKNEETDYMPVAHWNHDGWIAHHWGSWKFLKPLRFPEDTWHGSFAPVMRVSAKFVQHVVSEMVEHDLCFFEPFFPTVAKYYNLKVKGIDQKFTKNVRWQPEWTEEEMLRKKERQAQNISIFHPYKANQEHVIPAC